MPAVLFLGLTGGIGSGKSAVAARLAQRGAAIVDADAIAREVVAPGTAGLAAVVDAFGADVLRPDGSLDRPRLGVQVFADEKARTRLNAIVHPLIGQRTVELMATAEQAAASSDQPAAQLLVHDVPLLVENGLAPGYHLVAVVDASAETRLERLEARGLGRDDASQRIAAQADAEQRRAVADLWLDNSGSRDALAATVDRLLDIRLLPYAANLANGRYADRAPVALVEPDPSWASQGGRLVARLRHLAPDAVAVDHIGSTAVPGLLAKDVIDVQLTVPSWRQVESLRVPLADGGFPRRDDIRGDPPRPELSDDPGQWRKRLHRNADPGRAVNVHVRVAGTAAARASLAFRDRLRTDDGRRDRYAALKRSLAVRFPHDVDAYAEGKTAFVLAAVQA